MAWRGQAKLNQDEFGEKIGLKQSAVSRMEQQGSNVTEQNILLIADTFHVSEKWLRAGEGEMYEEEDEILLKQLALQYKLEGKTLSLIRNFLLLTDEQRAAILHAANIIAEANKKAQVKEKNMVSENNEE